MAHELRNDRSCKRHGLIVTKAVPRRHGLIVSQATLAPAEISGYLLPVTYTATRFLPALFADLLESVVMFILHADAAEPPRLQIYLSASWGSINLRSPRRFSGGAYVFFSLCCTANHLHGKRDSKMSLCTQKHPTLTCMPSGCLLSYNPPPCICLSLWLTLWAPALFYHQLTFHLQDWIPPPTPNPILLVALPPPCRMGLAYL